jgi:RNA polymerase sigma-70 factor (ECF subfamily)
VLSSHPSESAFAFDPVRCVESIRTGSPEHETALALHFQPCIHIYATRNLQNNRQAAEDVVQDTLWAAIKALREGRLNDPANLASFIYAIARHRVMDVHRGEARSRTDRLPEGFEPAVLPDATSASAERDQIAGLAIGELEPLDREVLNLVLVRGLNYAQIAEQLSITVAAVRQRKCRALRRVTERVREYFTPPRSQTTSLERQD